MNSYRDLARFERFDTKYRQSEFFTEYISTFLPPIYLMRMQRLSQKLGRNLVAAWAWESQNLAKEAGVEERLRDFGYFLGGNHNPALIGAASKLSEVYRSAYLRVLAWLRTRDDISEEAFVSHSLFTAPADISMLAISPGAPPKWWPKISLSNDADPQATIASLAAVSDLAGKELQQDWLIFAAEGAVLEDDASENASMHFSLLPFGYRILSAELPKPEEIFDLINGCGAESVTTTLAVLDAKRHAFVMPADDFNFGGVAVLPVFARLKDDSQNVWNWFRGYHEPFLLCPPALSPKYSFGYNSGSWFVETSGGKIAVGQDWRVGSLERKENGFSPLHGQYLTVHSDWLQATERDHDIRIAWVSRIKYAYRRQSYEKPKQYSQTSFVRLGTIIAS